MNRTRLVIFGVVCALCVVGAAVTIGRGGPATSVRVAGDAAAPVDLTAVTELGRRPHTVFVDTRLGDGFGRVSLSDASAASPKPLTTPLQCDRVDVAGGRGICLHAERGATVTDTVVVFDDAFQVKATHDIPGLPSRARVSPDGTRGAWTTFVSGDGYAAVTFSTRTELLDMATGDSLGDVEKFAVIRDGEPLVSPDFNVWGVTFEQDANRFYATLGTSGHKYLVHGDVAARTLTVLRDDVECPSLSPDGRLIAFKKRHTDATGRVTWRLSVLDVATLADHEVAETRNVDDQAAWLDPATVTYMLPEGEGGTPTADTWAVPADGSGMPRLVMAGASSLHTVHPLS